VATLSAEEGEVLGEALARSSSGAALDLFHSWLDIKGLLGRIGGIRAPVALQHVALGGLRAMGGEEAEGLLGHLAEKGSAEIKVPAQRALAARQGGRS
jgi:hypothetical protein